MKAWHWHIGRAVIMALAVTERWSLRHTYTTSYIAIDAIGGGYHTVDTAA